MKEIKERTAKQIHKMAEDIYGNGYLDGYTDGYAEGLNNNNECYKSGLNNAWNCAKKIAKICNDSTDEENAQLFGNTRIDDIIQNLSYDNAKTIIENYEKEKIEKLCENCVHQALGRTLDPYQIGNSPCDWCLKHSHWEPKNTHDDIKIGDEVEHNFNLYEVIGITESGQCCCVGKFTRIFPKEDLKRTGKTSETTATLIQQIKESRN